MSEPKMTEQEFRELISKDPLGYFSSLHEQQVTYLNGLVIAAKGAIGELSEKYLTMFSQLVTRHSKELSIFRALEVEMRNDTITPDTLREYLGRLAAFREQVQAEVKARSSAGVK